MSGAERIYRRKMDETVTSGSDFWGVAIFCGIGLLLSLLAMAFSWFGVLDPMFF